MSKKRKYRYSNPINGIVINLIKLYHWIKNDDSFLCVLFTNAIEKAISETMNEKDGDIKVKAVKMVYIEKTHNSDGAALELYVSPRTVRYWLYSFVNKVKKYSGFTI